MNARTLLLSAPLAIVLACGGTATTGSGSQALDAAVPAYASLALDQVSTDVSAPAAALVAAPDAGAAQPQASGGCRLFTREREVVERVNRHVYKVLRKVENVIAGNPVSATDTSKTWTKTESGVDIAFTIRLVGPNLYSWELAAGPTGTTPLRLVMSGEIDRNGYTGAHEGKGTMAIDFTAFHAAFPNERVASGSLDVRFDVSAAGRKVAVRGTDVKWDLDASHFDGSIPGGLLQPRSGEYVYNRVVGKGGSLKIQDELVSLCGLDPRTATVNLTPMTSQMVSRWFRTADGAVHGRSDMLLQGGALVAPVARVVGVTCRVASAEQQLPAEGYWLVKAEDASGNKLAGFEASVGDAAAVPCDPAFGAVPLLTSPASDFTAWPASYFDDPPYPFPGA